MNFHALSHFLAVVDHRSMTTAAKALNLSQSALTKSIKRLEQELGVQLLERLPRGIAPTRYGEILSRQARLAELEIQRGLAEIEAIGHGTGGVLRVGGTPIWTMTLIPQAAIGLKKLRPQARVRITTGMPDVLMRQLQNNEIDVMAVGIEYETGPDLIYELLASIEQTVYASIRHPLAGKTGVDVDELMAFPWVVFSHDPLAVSRIME
jgi:DNA-binding transcriptional LysR family regulator